MLTLRPGATGMHSRLVGGTLPAAIIRRGGWDAQSQPMRWDFDVQRVVILTVDAPTDP
jgi:hypothetical protein